MNNILEKKLSIIEWLLKIKDATIINKIELLQKTNVDHWDELTTSQKQEIEEAFAELESGKGIPHREVMAKFKR
jgi:predicted transcriptional regulator